ncbi:AsmA-like C-terminal region-containing protein [Gammaproteobacteria bacterium]|nr:AsmA-like C-terminal region-containing protein [Gammaproteobacteria bacterium]MDA9978729.1 AsmA-like C-terminal region-containing protein [Gammaproteobacteria bacterium]MDC3371890.1 AsmA-like C-terminal region-containing protein [Gammaproteobacteria bacterium]
MKKIIIHFLFVASCLSWVLFFILSFIFFSPNQTLQVLNNYLPSSYDLQYSEVVNNGSFLNPILEFSNISVKINDAQVFSANKSHYGFLVSPALIIGKLTITHIHLEKANILFADYSAQKLPKLKINLDKNISISFHETSLVHLGSEMLINGQLDSLIPGLANGHINISHHGKISNLSIDSDGEDSNFLVNLNTLDWLKFFPNDYLSSSKTMQFGITAIGSLTPKGSSIKGSLNLEESSFSSLTIKKNYGSFFFQSQDGLSILSLKNFLHPFVDEQFPIKFNLRNNAIAIPNLFLSNEVLEFQDSRFSNVAVKDIFATFKSGAIKYSGKIIDLDLLNVYFDELLNIQGFFFGTNNKVQFTITPSQSFIKNKDSDHHPIQITGEGSFTDSSFHLESRVAELAGSINLKLHASINQSEPLIVKLSGQNISKKMILTSLPQNFESVSEFLDNNTELSFSNNIFLDFKGSASDMKSSVKLKLSFDSSRVVINEGLDISVARGLLEMNKDNLYLHFLPGFVNQIPFRELHGKLQFSTQHLQYLSQHNFLGNEISTLLKDSSLLTDILHAKASSKGFFNLVSQKQFNSLSIKTKSFSIPVYQSNVLNLKPGQLFAIDFDRVYGKLPSQFLNVDSTIFLRGKNLLDNYELDLLLEAPLQPTKFIPDMSIFKVSGVDVFSAILSVTKNSSPVLKIFSELKGVEFNSKLPFLQKSKLSLLPTDIVITNFLDPEVFIKNSLIELKINSFQIPEGYIAIGKEMPKKYNFIKEAQGLNVYLGLDMIAPGILSNLAQSKTFDKTVNINNFFFDIGTLEVFNNQFSAINGSLTIKNRELKGVINSDKLNGIFAKDASGFLRIELEDTHLQDINFLKSSASSSQIETINARLKMKNSSIQQLEIHSLDVYLQKNKNLLTINNISLSSNLISISPLSKNSKAYFSVDSKNDIYKLRGSYLVKDSMKIPILQSYTKFSYFNGDINLQWQNLKRLQDIEGTLNFILKDFVVSNQATNSIALNLLGVLNLKNILGKVANLDLSINEFTSTQLNRVEGDLVFGQARARLASPLFIDTNAAKMKWIGQINKNSSGELSALDLNLDLRVRIGENIPWYAAILGGIPAVAGSAIISEIFEANINELSNYQYEVLGNIDSPKIQRIN